MKNKKTTGKETVTGQGCIIAKIKDQEKIENNNFFNVPRITDTRL